MTTTDLQIDPAAQQEPPPVESAYGKIHFDGSTQADPTDMPWLEWAGPGTYYKLLHLDADSGLSIYLLKVDPGVPPVPHKHHGAAIGWNLAGGWGYSDRWFPANTFFKEAGALAHAPLVGEEGFVMLAFGFGPIVFYDEQGNILTILDQHALYERAEAAGCADHIVFNRPPSTFVGGLS